MKRVIHIGGTGFSGSTFIAMILANDPQGFACGEPQNYLNPIEQYHPSLACGCGDEDCTLWSEIKRAGPESLYDIIFDSFPDVNFIVDSSKNPLWFRSQEKILSQKGIGTRNLLIWKTPLEIAHSFNKRGRLDEWEESWVNYHRMYYSVMDRWKAINYKRFTEDENELIDACEFLGISYFEGKKQFWEKTHHLIGGNHSAKIHLHTLGSKAYQDSMRRDPIVAKNPLETTHRTIYYQELKGASIKKEVECRIKNSKYIRQIIDLLESSDIKSSSTYNRSWKKIKFPWHLVKLRKLKRSTNIFIGNLRYGARN